MLLLSATFWFPNVSIGIFTEKNTPSTLFHAVGLVSVTVKIHIFLDHYALRPFFHFFLYKGSHFLKELDIEKSMSIFEKSDFLLKQKVTFFDPS